MGTKTHEKWMLSMHRPLSAYAFSGNGCRAPQGVRIFWFLFFSFVMSEFHEKLRRFTMLSQYYLMPLVLALILSILAFSWDVTSAARFQLSSLMASLEALLLAVVVALTAPTPAPELIG